MSGVPANPFALPRGPAWKWWVCGLLLLATMLNYMDRLTLNLTADDIMNDFGLNEPQYAQLESAFAFAFAIGAIVSGWMVDRWNVRWIYPLAILAWSAAGFASGLAPGFYGLLVCRFFLGLAEAGHWPCALRTTQHIISRSQRSLGNSILQSGAALGSILTPPIVLACGYWTGTWRTPFMVVGVLGVFWVFLWLGSVRREDLAIAHLQAGPSLVNILAVLIVLLAVDIFVHVAPMPYPWIPLATKVVVTVLGIGTVFLWLWSVTRDNTALPRSVFVRRFWVLVALVVSLNCTWHYFRAWMPLFLQRQHGYGKEDTSWFNSAYYLCADVGCLTAGFATLYLVRRGLTVHASRLTVFGACAALTPLALLAAFLPSGAALLALLLVIGFAALGLFPNYYSFSQEITVQYQGKVTGALGCITWLTMSLLHELVGDSIKRTGSYTEAMAVAGLLPLIGVGAMLLFWGKTTAQLDAVPATDDALAPVEQPLSSDQVRPVRS